MPISSCPGSAARRTALVIDDRDAVEGASGVHRGAQLVVDGYDPFRGRGFRSRERSGRRRGGIRRRRHRALVGQRSQPGALHGRDEREVFAGRRIGRRLDGQAIDR